MADRKAGAYGTSNGGDTGFRKTWDRAEYAEKAKASNDRAREEGAKRREAEAQGKKYHRRASTPPDAADTEARRARLDVSSNVGKTQIVAAGASVGKRGRGAGFYCEACDLTFKDNLQFVEHLNSKQHLVAVGQSGEVKRATLQEVRDRLQWLKRKREDEKRDAAVKLEDRLELAQDTEEKRREEKRRRRNEKRRKTKNGEGIKQEDPEDDGIIC